MKTVSTGDSEIRHFKCPKLSSQKIYKYQNIVGSKKGIYIDNGLIKMNNSNIINLWMIPTLYSSKSKLCDREAIYF